MFRQILCQPGACGHQVQPVRIHHQGNRTAGQHRLCQKPCIRLCPQARPQDHRIRPRHLFFDHIPECLRLPVCLLRPVSGKHRLRQPGLENLPVVLHGQKLHKTGSCPVGRQPAKVSGAAHAPAAGDHQQAAKGSLVAVCPPSGKPSQIHGLRHPCRPSGPLKALVREAGLCHLKPAGPGPARIEQMPCLPVSEGNGHMGFQGRTQDGPGIRVNP